MKFRFPIDNTPTLCYLVFVHNKQTRQQEIDTMTTFYVHDSADYYGSETTDAEATAYAEAIAEQLELYIADEWPDEDISIVVGDGTNRPGDDEVIADLHDVVQNNWLDWIADVAVAA